VAACAGDEIRQLDPVTGAAAGPPLTGAANVEALSYHPEGRLLAGAERTCVKVWDAESGELLLVLRAEPRTADNGFNPQVAWSPDGSRLAASNWDHAVNVWGGPAGDRWRAAEGRRADWHAAQGEDARRQGLAGAARRHLARLKAMPTLPDALLVRRGRLRAWLGDWAGARADMEMGRAALPAFGEMARHELASLYLLAGGSEAHARLAAVMLDDCGADKHPHELMSALLAAALAESPPANLGRGALRGAEMAAAPPLLGRLHHALALAEWRQGRPALALKHAGRAGADPTWRRMQAADWLAKALALKALGRRAEAEAMLARADAWMATTREALPRDGAAVPTGLRTDDWLHLVLLHAEARRRVAPVALGMPRAEG